MKMKYLDMAVTAIFILSLFVIYFFWGCEIDLYITVLAVLVIAVSVLTTRFQYKKMNELGIDKEEG